MLIHTASEGIALAKKLESESAEFYEAMAEKYPNDAEALLALAKENRKNIVQTERVYYGVITDAIEGSYAFNLDPDDYVLSVNIKGNSSYTDVIKQAIAIEEKIVQFYKDAASQSRSLMADIPRAFDLLVRKRLARIEKLKSVG